jgi:hypothetical protein
MKLFSFISCFLIASALSSFGLSQGPSLSSVLQSSPVPANAVLFLNVPSLRQIAAGSPLESELANQVTDVRLAASLDFSMMQPDWEIGYALLTAMPSHESLAKRYGGYIDEVSGRKVVWTPKQMYLVPLENNVLAIIRPTDRKLLGQWLRKDRMPQPSEILKTYAGISTDSSILMMGIDVQDLFSPTSIETQMANFPSIDISQRKTLSQRLATLNGIQLMLGKDKQFTVRLSFASSPADLQSFAKPFLKELLARNGASFAELDQWSVSVDKNELLLRGAIPVAIIDDLLGIFTVHRQASNASDSQGTESVQTTSESVVAETSKAYFNKISGIVNRVRDYSAKNTGDRARWNGHMARKIDELPTLNVDSELVAYSAEVAKSLRDNMVSLQLTNIQAGAINTANNAGSPIVNVSYGYGYGYGYGSYYYDPNSGNQVTALGQSQGNSTYRQVLAVIEQSQADMRRRMTDKYKLQF